MSSAKLTKVNSMKSVMTESLGMGIRAMLDRTPTANEIKEKFNGICRKVLNAFTYPSPMSYTPDQAANSPYP